MLISFWVTSSGLSMVSFDCLSHFMVAAVEVLTVSYTFLVHMLYYFSLECCLIHKLVSFSGRLMMASTSGQGFKSNRDYRCWLTETFDGHETADDELSDDLDGNDNMIQPSLQTFPLNLEPIEPFLGMEFESAEDAREVYEMYGRHMGFTIRNNRTRRSLKDNSIIGREFVCSKEGFRIEKYANRRNGILPSQRATREGCNAMMRISAKDGGKWVIYGFVKEHNHELNPSKIPPRRSHRIAFCEVCLWLCL